MKPCQWHFSTSLVARLIKPARKEKTVSKVQKCFPISIPFKPVPGNSSFDLGNAFPLKNLLSVCRLRHLLQMRCYRRHNYEAQHLASVSMSFIFCP